MVRLTKFAILAAVVSASAACTTDRPALTGTSYSCSGGTELRVNYIKNGALVSINGARSIPFKQTPSTSGATYENGAISLARSGNLVTWSTAQRSAPETCTVVNTIN